MILVASNGLPGLHRVGNWFDDPGNWWGPSGLVARLDEHVVYSLVLVLAAVVLALPLGLLIGHSGRGVALLAGAANGLRAIPSLGLLLFLIVLLSPRVHVTSGFTSLIARGSVPYLIPAMIVLLVVAVPPILTSTYAGVQSVDRVVRDAARGAGMSPLQVMTKVELPCALPLIMSGVRNATLEVIATLTVAAYAPLVGGLGRLIVDGDQNLSDPRYGYPAMVAAAITIAALALVADALLALVQRSIVSPGISGRCAPNGTLRRTLIRAPIHSTARHAGSAGAQGGR
jgi:osmoprotectant transport system permease protein